MTQQHESVATSWLEAQYDRFEQNLNGTRGSNLIHQSRTRAFAAIEQRGFPTPADEDWKYTDLSALLREAYQIKSGRSDISAQQIAALLPAKIDAHTLVLVDGAFRPNLSNFSGLSGVEIVSLHEICSGNYQAPLRRWIEIYLSQTSRAPQRHFSALNAAFLRDGLVVYAARDSAVEKPLHIIHLVTSSDAACLHTPRVLIRLEEGAQLKVIESFLSLSEAKYLSVPLTEIELDARSQLEYVRMVRESSTAGHISTIFSQQQTDSHLAIHTYNLSGRLIRNDIESVLGGERAMTILNGLSVLTNAQHVDNSTVLDHAAPHCESRELYKGIYSDSSRGVFSGTIIVRPDAQKTNAIQSNRALLLSGESSIDSRPQLKIWADDVKCTHGATVGQLDDDALFYLRSRGISKQAALEILTDAFAGEVITTIADRNLREFVTAACKRDQLKSLA